MRAFVTGATGFIGGHVARVLRDRSDDVVALVRNPAKAGALRALGCELVEGDLESGDALHEGMRGSDVVFHIAAVYRVGIKKSDCSGLHEANVAGTRRVLEAAATAGAKRIVYVSTVGYFGNTRGRVVEESFERTDLQWLSCYDETKYRAHQVATEFIESGAPVVIAMPGGVYGPGDTSDLRLLIGLARRGWIKVLVMPETGFNFGYVEDIATGIVLVGDKGRTGESYVLGGELTTAGDLLKRVAVLSGHKPPSRTLPTWVVKGAAPIWPAFARLLKAPSNLREIIAAGDGVTYWASDAKARRELGYSPRGLQEGLEATLRGWA